MFYWFFALKFGEKSNPINNFRTM